MTVSPSVKICSSDDGDINDLNALASGEIQALVLRRFTSEKICSAAVSALDRTLLGNYDPARYVVPAQRFGPTLNEYRIDDAISADYWERARHTATIFAGNDVLKRLRQTCLARLSALCGTPCVAAVAEGGRLHWGILREINHGTLIHWDDILEEYPIELLTTRITGQLAFNLFLSAPAAGGETSVWAKERTEADERYRSKFGYRPEVVHGVAATSVKSEQGAAVLFNARNYHCVHPCAENETRLTLSFFVGLTEQQDKLILWS
jgi:hypothetical protein